MFNQFSIFTVADKKDFDQLMKKFRSVKLKAGEVLFNQGDVGDTLFLVEEGSLEIIIQGDNKEQTVAVLKPGDIVGEMALVTKEVRSATVKTSEETRLLALTKERFDEILKADPKIAIQVVHNVAALLAKRLQTTNKLIDKIAQKNGGVSSSEIATLKKQLFERWDF
tara:strand:+ start:74983 stop:75483 length:501 start_codon:yes stop_codon:yes gene_type:complete